METNDPNQNCKRIRRNAFLYTREQKLVMTVWFHERLFTGLTFDQLSQNFLVRFKTASPCYRSVAGWEKQLFKHGSLPVTNSLKFKNKATLARLVHVPYVKESLTRFPDLTLKGRANLLGLCVGTLSTILKEDLKYDLDNHKKAETEKS